MADIVDRAQETVALDLAVSVVNARAAVADGPGREFCLNCEEPIPQARREAAPGCQLCIQCQRESEARGKR